MQFDRKLLLIAPTIVLVFVVAGMIYAALQLHLAASGSESLDSRSAFIGSVERGEKTLSQRQAAGIIRLSLQVEQKRTAALIASRDVLVALSAISLAAIIVLVIGVRSVPREHWPRFSSRRSPPP